MEFIASFSFHYVHTPVLLLLLLLSRYGRYYGSVGITLLLAKFLTPFTTRTRASTSIFYLRATMTPHATPSDIPMSLHPRLSLLSRSLCFSLFLTHLRMTRALRPILQHFCTVLHVHLHLCSSFFRSEHRSFSPLQGEFILRRREEERERMTRHTNCQDYLRMSLGRHFPSSLWQ